MYHANERRPGNMPNAWSDRIVVLLLGICLATMSACREAPTVRDAAPKDGPGTLLTWDAISGQQFAAAQPTKRLSGVNGSPELLLRRDDLKKVKSKLAGLQAERRTLKGNVASLKADQILAGLQLVAEARSTFDSLLLSLLQHRYATMQYYLLDKHENEKGYEGYTGACFGFFIATSNAAEQDLKRRLGEILSTVNDAATMGTRPTKVELASLLGNDTDVEQWAKALASVVEAPKGDPSPDNIRAFAVSAISGMEVYEELADLTFRRMLSTRSFDEALNITEAALLASFTKTKKELGK